MSDISKLPKWAQQHIEDLQRQRDIAVKRLNEMTDDQTPSPFYADQYDSTKTPPESRRVYFQAHRMTVGHLGLELDIILRDDGIDCAYYSGDRRVGDICLTPTSFQSFTLKPRDQMRYVPK
jgi:hypothetical protein